MGVVKIASTRSDYKLIGVYLRSRVHAYLSLYAQAKGITKSSLLKELILDWVDSAKESETDEEMAKQISARVLLQWQTYIKKKPYTNIERYRLKVEKELLAKGIEEKHILMITKVLR